MNYRTIGIIGLVFLIVSRLLLVSENEIFGILLPFDAAHILMLFGAVMTTTFIAVFPKNIFNTIGAPLIVLGAIAHVGMCSIDFVFGSFGKDYDS